MPSPTHSLLQVRGLSFAWPGQAPVFLQLDIDLPAGVSAVVGDESTGKTTLLRLLAGDLAPQAGTVSHGGRVLAPAERARLVFRTEPRSEALDAQSATTWFASLARTRPGFESQALPGLIEGFSLGPHVDKPLYMLSTGSKRKVWLCAALAAGAPVTLLDEPFAALDRASIGFLTEQLRARADVPSRVWLLADHLPPPDLALARLLELPA